MAQYTLPTYDMMFSPYRATLISTTGYGVFTTVQTGFGTYELTANSLSAGVGTALLIEFSSSDLDQFKRLYVASVAASVTPLSAGYSIIFAILGSSYSSGKTLSVIKTAYASKAEDGTYEEDLSYPAARDNLENILKYGIVIYSSCKVSISSSSKLIKMRYAFPHYYGGMSPSDEATLDKRKDIIFSWRVLMPDANSENPPYSNLEKNIGTQTFLWREDGTTDWKQIDCGANTTVTVPSGTFTGDKIWWKPSGLMADRSPIDHRFSDYSLIVNAPDSIPIAIAVSPQNTVVDKTKGIEFVWRHVIDTGTEQTKADLQTSTDGNTFLDLATVIGSESRYSVPAGMFASDTLYWRVRTYNSDGVAGEWSDSARFILFGAPDAPLVRLVSVSPLATIAWSSIGQVAYEVMVDGQTTGTIFGQEKQYASPQYLNDGQHTMQVRIQNRFSMWSEWSSATFTVVNSSGPIITLSVAAGTPADLQWSTDGSYDAYLVYRDGQFIGRTTETMYRDHFALGPVTYRIRGVYEDTGYYTMSNSAQVEIAVDTLMISPVTDPTWLILRLSSTQIRSRTQSAVRSVGYLHLVGSALPNAEIGEAEDRTYRFDAAFKRGNGADYGALERLLGKLVCVKDPDGMIIVGVFGTYTMTSNRFYRSYNCQITLTDWEEGA